tara:strand:- start:315 stop:611 length:297 start_codon:yes stop_codon:yes gene_type:complete
MSNNPTNADRMTRPVWTSETTVQAVGLTGGFDALTITGYYILINNVGANNVYIGPDAATPGVLLQPGETFETAISPGSPIYAQGTAAQPISIIEYKGQ